MASSSTSSTSSRVCEGDWFTYVDATEYASCKAHTGFTFDGSLSVDMDKFCADLDCRRMFDELQQTQSVGCLHTAAMAPLLAVNDYGATIVNCEGFAPVTPTGEYSGCTPAMRELFIGESYRQCAVETNFSLLASSTEVGEVDTDAFCRNGFCLAMFNQLQDGQGTNCLKGSNLPTDRVKTSVDGTTVDCSKVEDNVAFTLLPTGTVRDKCTPRMRRNVTAITTGDCYWGTQFSFQGDETVNVEGFCGSPSCQKLFDQLQAGNGTLCVDLPGLEEVVTVKNGAAQVDCSSFANGLEFAPLPVGVLGRCTEAMRHLVDPNDYRACRASSGFRFGGTDKEGVKTDAFCSTKECQAVFDALQAAEGTICLDIPGMSDILTLDDESRSATVSCEGVSTTNKATVALDFTAVPSGALNGCTQRMRSKVNPDSYRTCHKDSKFAFDDLAATVASAFCSSSACAYVYDNLLVAGGLSCVAGLGTSNAVVVPIEPDLAVSGKDWCRLEESLTTRPSQSSGSSDKEQEANQSTESSGPTTGVVVGIAVSVVLAVVVVIFLVYRTWKRRRQHGGPTGTEDENDGDYVQAQGKPIIRSKKSGLTGSSASAEESRDADALLNDIVIKAARIPYEKLVFGRQLGEGGYGTVYQGTYRGGPVAIKALLHEKRYDITHIENLLLEVKVMAGMEHPRIVTLIGVAWDSLNELCIVSELMSGGDLRSTLMRFSDVHNPMARPRGFDADKIRIALHVSHALAYLHTLQPPMLHRDLKSRNILLDDALNAKVTDFGVSRFQEECTMTVGVGSALWMAPEVMIGGRYDEKADIFSFGVVLSELDTHAVPYSNVSEPGTQRRLPDQVILQMMMAGRAQVAFSNPPETCAMVQLGLECVAVNPTDRPTTAELLSRVHKISRGGGYLI